MTVSGDSGAFHASVAQNEVWYRSDTTIWLPGRRRFTNKV